MVPVSRMSGVDAGSGAGVNRGRRRSLRAGAVSWAMSLTRSWPLSAGLLGVRPAGAHHGFLGKHDFSQPLYVAGRVTRVYAGHPHARLTLQVPDALHLPRDRERMRPLEDAEARQTTTMLALLKGRGSVDVMLDWRLTRRLIDEPDALGVGDGIEAVVYRRTSGDEYRNELQAALLVLAGGQVVVSSSPNVGRELTARSPGR